MITFTKGKEKHNQLPVLDHRICEQKENLPSVIFSSGFKCLPFAQPSHIKVMKNNIPIVMWHHSNVE